MAKVFSTIAFMAYIFFHRRIKRYLKEQEALDHHHKGGWTHFLRLLYYFMGLVVGWSTVVAIEDNTILNCRRSFGIYLSPQRWFETHEWYTWRCLPHSKSHPAPHLRRPSLSWAQEPKYVLNMVYLSMRKFFFHLPQKVQQHRLIDVGCSGHCRRILDTN